MDSLEVSKLLVKLLETQVANYKKERKDRIRKDRAKFDEKRRARYKLESESQGNTTSGPEEEDGLTSVSAKEEDSPVRSQRLDEQSKNTNGITN